MRSLAVRKKARLASTNRARKTMTDSKENTQNELELSRSLYLKATMLVKIGEVSFAPDSPHIIAGGFKVELYEPQRCECGEEIPFNLPCAHKWASWIWVKLRSSVNQIFGEENVIDITDKGVSS